MTESDREGHLADSESAFVDMLGRLAALCGARSVPHRGFGDASLIDIEFSPHFPMWLRFEVLPAEERALMTGVVRTTGLPGDRSDYHDLISAIWALVLRCRGVASVRLVDVPHPVVPGELHSRFVLFDKQPAASYISLRDPDIAALARVMSASVEAAEFFSAVWREAGGDHDTETCGPEGGAEWAAAARSALRVRKEGAWEVDNLRRYPDWEYWRDSARGLAAMRFAVRIRDRVSTLLSEPYARSVPGVDGSLLADGPLRNAAGQAALGIVARLSKAFGAKLPAKPRLLSGAEGPLLVPVDSHLIAVFDHGLVVAAAECGPEQYAAQRDALALRHREEAALLYPVARFGWGDKLDDDRFELLVLELLRREPGMSWARKAGKSRAPDVRRDIIADWHLGPAPWQRVAHNADMPFVRRRVIVQCKAVGRSVNFADVGDVPSVLDFHDASGFLLVVSREVTPQLIDYLTRVPERRGFWCDWWTVAEIEERLRANPDVAARYPDLVTTISGAPPTA